MDEQTHFMTTVIARGSPSSIFETIMNEDERLYWDAATSSHTVIDRRDDHCDYVHLIQRPVWISSLYLWSKPRDLVLLRWVSLAPHFLLFHIALQRVHAFAHVPTRWCLS